MSFQVSDRRLLYTEKSENATPELFAIYMQSKANESVSECLKDWVKHL